MDIVAYKTNADLEKAIKILARRDPVLRQVYKTYGLPAMRRQRHGFAGLVRLFISQQVSTAAARAIQGRFVDLIGDVTPAAYLSLDDEALAACGLSRPKRRYLKALAQVCLTGGLDFKRLHRRRDDEIRTELTALLGIGAWTAECYLLFCLQRADIFPAGDLALQEGYKILYNKRQRPDEAQLVKYAEDWKPYRGAAARLLWRFYNGYKQAESGKKKS